MRTLQALSIAAIVIVSAACGGAASGGPASGAATVAVEIKGFQYLPATLEVTRGTTVVWTNRDDIFHSATAGTAERPAGGTGSFAKSASGAFDGPMDAAGKSFRFTFTEPGEYAYFCDRHPHMTGKVVVR